MRHTGVYTAVPAVGHQTHGDQAAAIAAQLETLALQVAVSSNRGHVSPCRIAFRLDTMSAGFTIPAVASYPDIWAVVVDWIGETQLREEYGITNLAGLMSPMSPIKVAFARQMPRGADMPDEIVVDGNDARLKSEVHTTLLMDIVAGGDYEPEAFEFVTH